MRNKYMENQEKKQYNKLVRDKIPEFLTGKGISFEVRVASEEEYKTELFKKLQEEVKEFSEANDIEELADILEVIDAIKKLPEFANVAEVKNKKFEERGGFEKRIIAKGEK